MNDFNNKNFYELLSISFDASTKEIRTAYIKKASDSHPDKLGIDESSEYWYIANDFIKNINEAYSILTDPIKRNNYDKLLKEKEVQNNHPSKAQPQSKHHSKSKRNEAKRDEESTYQTKIFSFKEANRKFQKIILERQNGKHIIKLKLGSALSRYIWSAIMLLWIPILYSINHSKDERIYAVYFFISLVIFLLLLRNFLFLKDWYSSTIKCNLIVTPLYFIETNFDKIQYWYLWELIDIRATHNYVNGLYSNTTVTIIFPDKKIPLFFNSIKKYETFIAKINEQISNAEYAKYINDKDYLFHNDDLTFA